MGPRPSGAQPQVLAARRLLKVIGWEWLGEIRQR